MNDGYLMTPRPAKTFPIGIKLYNTIEMSRIQLAGRLTIGLGSRFLRLKQSVSISESNARSGFLMFTLASFIAKYKDIRH